MSRITEVFRPRHKALIGYITAGYPTIEATPEIVSALVKNGCDIIELGIPFSDPLADGMTIQKSSYEALLAGVTPRACLDIAADVRKKVNTPLLFMTYYNPVLNYGLEAFCRSCVNTEVDGLIVPDLPPEEGLELEKISKEKGIDLVYLLAPTSTEERITTVAERSRGFIYIVSVTGVTGARDTLPAELEDFIYRVKEKANQPLCVGFGVSTPEHAKRVALVADGIIVGSRLIQLIEEDTTLVKLIAFISGMREALDTFEIVKEVG